eukprot:scaffold51830_cov32-Tisochrysis_lutea.AAC.5
MNGTPARGPSPRTHDTRASARRAGFTTTVDPRQPGRVTSRETAMNSASMATRRPGLIGSSSPDRGRKDGLKLAFGMVEPGGGAGTSRKEYSGATWAASGIRQTDVTGSEERPKGLGNVRVDQARTPQAQTQMRGEPTHKLTLVLAAETRLITGMGITRV